MILGRGVLWAARAGAALCFVLLYVPLVVLVMTSFFKRGEGWTLHWYLKALSNEQVLAALGVSLWVGLWTTVVATVIGTLGALALERGRFRGKALLEAAVHAPLVMPEIVMALSLLIWFVWLRITLGQLSIILAHITFSISYVVVTVRARLHGFDPALEEAARDLGATPLLTFLRVTLPLAMPGIVSGALMAFTLSFDDFLITFFTAGVGYDTLPVKIYSMVKFGVSPEINAVSTVLLVATFLLVLLFSFPKGGPKLRVDPRQTGL